MSSWDKTGGNADDVELKPGETLVIADIKGVGAIKYFWMTMASDAPHHLRELVLRMCWDGENVYGGTVAGRTRSSRFSKFLTKEYCPGPRRQA